MTKNEFSLLLKKKEKKKELTLRITEIFSIPNFS